MEGLLEVQSREERAGIRKSFPLPLFHSYFLSAFLCFCIYLVPAMSQEMCSMLEYEKINEGAVVWLESPAGGELWS